MTYGLRNFFKNLIFPRADYVLHVYIGWIRASWPSAAMRLFFTVDWFLQQVDAPCQTACHGALISPAKSTRSLLIRCVLTLVSLNKRNGVFNHCRFRHYQDTKSSQRRHDGIIDAARTLIVLIDGITILPCPAYWDFLPVGRIVFRDFIAQTCVYIRFNRISF